MALKNSEKDFKDGTKLDISSETGSYNNSTLDMKFKNNELFTFC